MPTLRTPDLPAQFTASASFATFPGRSSPTPALPTSPSDSHLGATPSLITSPYSPYGSSSSSGHEAVTPSMNDWDAVRPAADVQSAPYSPLGLGLANTLVQAESEQKPMDDAAPSVSLSPEAAFRQLTASPDELSWMASPPSQIRALRSQFSDASLAESFHRSRSGKSSDLNLPALEHMPDPRTHSLYSNEQWERPDSRSDVKRSTESSASLASRDSQASGFGSEDDTLGGLINSYMYGSASDGLAGSRGSLASIASLAKSPEASPVKQRGMSLMERRRKDMVGSVGEEVVEELDEGVHEEEYASPARPNANNLATELRDRLQRSQGTHDLSPHLARTAPPRPMLPTSDSNDSLMQRIPRLSTLFPRSTTDDSLASINITSSQSMDSIYAPESPVKRWQPPVLAVRLLPTPTTVTRPSQTSPQSTISPLAAKGAAHPHQRTRSRTASAEVPITEGVPATSSIQSLGQALADVVRPDSPPPAVPRSRTRSADDAGSHVAAGRGQIAPVYFSPPRQSSLPRSRGVIGLPDSPANSRDGHARTESQASLLSLQSNAASVAVAPLATVTEGQVSPVERSFNLQPIAPLSLPVRKSSKSSNRSLTISSPKAVVAESTPMAAWRAPSTNSPVNSSHGHGLSSPAQVDDLFTSPASTPVSATFATSLASPTGASHISPPILQPAISPASSMLPHSASRNFFDDPDAIDLDKPFRSKMPKLTIPNDSNQKTGFEYALRPAAEPLTSSTTASNAMSVAMSLSPSVGSFASPRGASMDSERPIMRSRSTNSLREGRDSPGSTRSAKLVKKPSRFNTHLHSSSIDDSQSTIGQPLSPASTSSPQTTKALASSKSSRGLFGRTKKDEPKPTKYQQGISSKDLEDETVVIGREKVEFEMIKPLKLELLKDELADFPMPPRSFEMGRSESFNSANGPSQDSFLESEPEFDTPRWVVGGLTPYGAGASSLKSSVSMASLGNYSPPPAVPATAEQDAATHRQREADWLKLLGALSPAAAKHSKKTRQLIAAGVPSSVRGKVWSFLSEADSLARDGPSYATLCGMEPPLCLSAIEHEATAAIVRNPHFAEDPATMTDMVEVLSAVARIEPELGVGHGVAVIAGVLLSQLPAEQAFWVMLALIRSYGFASSFGGKQHDLAVDILTFDYLLDATHPKLAKRLNELGVDLGPVYAHWMATLFSTLPLATQLRLTDAILFDDKFRLRAALAILDLSGLMDGERFGTAEGVVGHLMALSDDGGLAPALLVPAAMGTRVKDGVLRKCVARAQKEVGVRA